MITSDVKPHHVKAAREILASPDPEQHVAKLVMQSIKAIDEHIKANTGEMTQHIRLYTLLGAQE